MTVHGRLAHIGWLLILAMLVACSSPTESSGEAAEEAESGGAAAEETAAPEDIAGAGARAAEDGSEHAVYAWYLGLPVLSDYLAPEFLGGSGPNHPVPEVPDLNLYLIGPVDDTTAQSAPRELPIPPFAEGANVLPAHQNTVDTFTTADEPHDALGFWVAAGPDGVVDENVRVREDPPDSIPGAPLAYEVKIAGSWLPLTNHLVIEYGVELGILRTIAWEEGFGGQNWSTFPDEALRSATVTTSERSVHIDTGS